MKWKTFCYRLRSIVAYFCTLLFVVPGIAQAQTPGDIAWAELLQGRAVALIRHTVAPGFGDPSGFILGDCVTHPRTPRF